MRVIMIIDVVHCGPLGKTKIGRDRGSGFAVTVKCPGVSASVLVPRQGWVRKSEYQAAQKPAGLSRDNFQTYKSGVGPDIRAVCPA
jgi:ATP-dependent phosphoenolpyruvate carboxykinase